MQKNHSFIITRIEVTSARRPAKRAPHIAQPTKRRLGCLLVAWASVLAGTAIHAANIVINYQGSQYTGYSPPSGAIFTVGGNVTSLNFNDGSANGQLYNISALTFGQGGGQTNPVYEASPANATVNFVTTLNNAFGSKTNYVYQNAFAAANEFSIQSYSVFATNGGAVGEDMYAVYNPGAGDPATNNSNPSLHWMQVIWDNWAIAPSGKSATPGQVENIVDNGGAGNPYYDTKGTAGFTKIAVGTKLIFNFYDSPSRLASDLQNYTFGSSLKWMAEDFLVSDTGAQNGDGKDVVNVYGGIEYGWQVTLIPEPGVLPMAAVGALLIGFLRHRATRSGKPVE